MVSDILQTVKVIKICPLLMDLHKTNHKNMYFCTSF